MAETKTREEQRFDSVETLSKAKILAENRVKLVKSLLEEGEIEDKDYKKIHRIYGETRADVNAGLDRILVELESTGKKGALEPYKRVAQHAAERTEEFFKTSDRVIFGKDRSAVESGIKFAESLINAFVDVWKLLHGEKNERHVLLLQRIESLKWAQFSDIK